MSEPEIPEALWKAAGGTESGLGTGGMLTKLQAADLARRSGTTVIIASGETPDVLLRAAAGETVGTRFLPVATSVESRKRYILTGGRAAGAVRIDSGAVQALARGSSLLPVGVKSVEGSFERGDSIRVLDPGREGDRARDHQLRLERPGAHHREEIRRDRKPPRIQLRG